VNFGRICFFLLLVTAVSAPALAQAPWYTAYYASWNQTSFNGSSWSGEKLGQPPDQVDWTGVTHVVHFGNGNVTTTSPYFLFATDSTEITYGPGGGSVNYQNQLISVCHAKSIKVLLSIQAVDGSALLAVVQDANKLSTFCEWVVQYCKRRGYDGVEIDWESSFPSTSQMTAFITKLRETLDKYYSPVHAVIATSANLSDYNMYAPALDAMIDQYNIQTYAMMWTPNDNNLTWHTCAVYPGTSANGAEGALDGVTNGDVGYPQKWVNAGHDPGRIGLLLPTFGYFCLGADGLLQKPTSVIGHNGSMTVTQNRMLTGLTTVGGTVTWDAVRQMDYISGTATAAYGAEEYGGVKAGQKFFATVPTPRWVQAVVDYYKTKKFNGKSLGGLSLYSLTEDFEPSKPAGAGRNIIHDALRDALSGAGFAPFGSLTATPSSLAAGDSTTLSWTSSGATAGSIDNGIGAVSLPGGSRKVKINAATTFILTLTNASGTSTYSATVTIAAAAVPTGTLTVTPATVASGDSVTLAWTSSGATGGSIDHGVGVVTLPSGSRKVRVDTTSHFVLSLTNATGTTTKTARANVTPAGKLTASPSTVTQGDSTTLSWTVSANADSAVVNGGVGKVALPSGSRRVRVNTTTKFRLTMYNAAGTRVDSVTVTAVPAGAPTGTFAAAPTHVTAGDSVTLSWTSSGATTASIAPGVGSVTPAAGGSKKVRVGSATTFVLSLGNGTTTTTYNAAVTIDSPAVQPPPVTDPPAPKEYHLDQNYPNPFNPSTHITYRLPAATTVRLSVYNILGQEMMVLVDGFQPAGIHEVVLSGDRLPNGLYFYFLVTPEFRDARKMTVIH
jgi:hypothetical protein